MEIESNVAYYSKKYPCIWAKAENAILIDEKDECYIDFLASAGSVNYGHNNKEIINQVMKYLQDGGIVQGLDMDTIAKKEFIKLFTKEILEKKGLNYKLQFTGPTGANAIEAAIKLARKVKKRDTVFAFQNGFHGMTATALAASSMGKTRCGIPGDDIVFIPYWYLIHRDIDVIEYMMYLISNDHSGVKCPAAIIIETIQGEGGVQIFDDVFLKRLELLCEEKDILLICDDIQMGCYRTGEFFSFERLNMYPDIVVLSKSLSGFGTPMSMLLMKPEYDLWFPGEHSGTFRGNQLGMIGAKASLEFAKNYNISKQVINKEKYLWNLLRKIKKLEEKIIIRGRGLVFGIDFSETEIKAEDVNRECFKRKLIVEDVGNQVLKILPPLTIENDFLEQGVDIIFDSISNLN
mgnify:CR=1 FL=1